MSRTRSLLPLLLAGALSLTACGVTDAGDAASQFAPTSSQSSAEASPVPEAEQLPMRKVRQKARLTVLPQLADPGKKDRNANRAKSVLQAKFKPRKKGRPVVLQRRQGRRWVTVDRARQNRRGKVDFTAPYKYKRKPAKYRVKAPRHRRLRAVKSRAESTDQFTTEWLDQFGGRTLGVEWNHQVQGYQPASSRTCSRVDPTAVDVRRGVAKIRVMADPVRTAAGDKCNVEGGSYHYRLNGHINTQGTKEFTRGFSAARVKFQRPRGQHASFWFYNVPTAHEIDTIEYFGKGHPQGGMTSFVYSDGVKIAPGCSGSQDQGCGFIGNLGKYGKKWWSRYHVFSVERTDKATIFRIDGKQTFRTKEGVSDQPSYMNLSLLASDYELKYLDGDNGEDNEGKDAADKLKRVAMSVDWVRHWSR